MKSAFIANSAMTKGPEPTAIQPRGSNDLKPGLQISLPVSVKKEVSLQLVFDYLIALFFRSEPQFAPDFPDPVNSHRLAGFIL